MKYSTGYSSAPYMYYVNNGDSKSSLFRLKIPYLVDIPGVPTFTIPVHVDGKPFDSDFASVPRILRVVYDRIDFGLVAPLVHDYLCITKGELPDGQQLSSTKVHEIFRDIMEYEDVPKLRRMIAYYCVLWFGPRWS
jgi:hypothetical protein